jgi:16S rRNA (cytosine967-C5)-methyltransferase
VLDGRPNILGLDSWRRGLFEVQDDASQCVTIAAQARPGELVVDLCAGSGGKTLALAADLAGQGRLVAVDVNPQRLRDLAVRAARAGAGGIEPRPGDATQPALTRDLEGRCDLVLVDAPCSELGVLRRSPDARWRLAPDAPDAFAPLQAELLARAALLVRPGGRVAYSTCSVDRAENEAVLETAPPSLTPISARTLRPDRDGCDGFFIAMLVASPQPPSPRALATSA